MKTFGRKPRTSFKIVRMNFAGSKYVASKERENKLIEKIDNKRVTSNLNCIPVSHNPIGRVFNLKKERRTKDEIENRI